MLRRTRRFAILPAVVLLTATLLLPIIETDMWWIRFLDFPRVQFLVSLSVFLGLYLILGGWLSPVGKFFAVAALATLLYQGVGIVPYIFSNDKGTFASCVPKSQFKIMVANVQKDNRLGKRFFDLVADTDPAFLLVLETDEWWDDKLKKLHPVFGHRHQHIPTDARFYGMHLLSKYKLINPQIRTYVDIDTPTIITGVDLSRANKFTFIGIHPRPPTANSQPSTKRDANMLAAALDAREIDDPVVMAGDFNATPWERTMLRALRIGAFIDPRVNNGLIPTYSATNWAMAWPLDHIVYQSGLVVKDFRRLPPFGSDHYAVVADLCLRDIQVSPVGSHPVSPDDLEDAYQTITKAKTIDQLAAD